MSENGKILSKKYIFYLVFLCAAIYFTSYVTRINYSAVLVEIMKSEGYSKTAASVPLTGLFIVYGIGQLISGWLGDKFSPEKIIFCGLITTAVMNSALPFAPTTGVMTIIWSINGFAQALMWPPLVKILAKHLTKDDYAKNIAYISFGSSLGTIFVYAVSPIVIAVSSWKSVFFGASSIALIIAVVWMLFIFRIEKHTTKVDMTQDLKNIKTATRSIPFSKAAILLLFLVMFANIFQGLLRDGITTWMPTYMSDTFGFGSSSAILTGVALPIATMAISVFTTALFRKVLKNEAKCTTLYFSICTAACLVLCLANSANPALSTIMLMVANASSAGINFMYTAIVVAKFAPFGKTSFVTGALNSSVYIGSALSTYGIAAITQVYGWSGTMIAWLITSVIGLITCVLSIRPFSKNV